VKLEKVAVVLLYLFILKREKREGEEMNVFRFLGLFVLLFQTIFIFDLYAPKVDHGWAIVERVRNETVYPLKIRARKPLTQFKKPKKSLFSGQLAKGESIELKRKPRIMGAEIKVEGFCKQEIPTFPSGGVLQTNPLGGEGFAWQGKSIPENATIFFRARARDEGNIVIALSDRISPDYVYKIIIGAEKNSESVIIKRDPKTKKEKVVYRITRDENSFAATTPGRFTRFWVSRKDKLILVGAGCLGCNPFMSFYDTDAPANINRIGFGSGNDKVDYADIQVTVPMVPTTRWRPYGSFEGPAQFKGSLKNYQRSKNPLRLPGNGTIAFTAKSEGGIAVGFGDNLEYELLIGTDANSRTILRRKGKEVSSVLAQASPDVVVSAPGEDELYWVCTANGQFLYGKGKDVGKRLLFAWKDSSPLKISNAINLGAISATQGYEIGGEVKYKDLKIGPPLELTFDIDRNYYKREKELFRFPDSFEIITPLKYSLFQVEQSVGVKDELIGKTYYIQKVPNQDSEYFFQLVVSADGVPDLLWTRSSEPSATEVRLQKTAHITGATSQASLQAAGGVSMGAGKGAGGMVTAVAGVGLAAAGIGAAAGAAAAEFALSRYRGDDAYVFMEAANKEAFAGAEVPDRAKENRQAVMMRTQEAMFEQDPATLLIMYQDIVDLVNHFYVVEEPYVKKKIFDAIEKLYNLRYKQQSIDFYAGLLKLLCDARDNPYLTDVSEPKEKTLKNQWYIWSNEIAQELYNARNMTEAGFAIPPSYGEPYWIPDKFTTEGEGSFRFQAKGLGDIFVCLGQRPFKTRNTDNQVYEFDIGAWDNSKTVLRFASLGKSVKEVLKEDYPEAMADPLEFKKYWINLEANGEISFGTSSLRAKNTVFKMKDPYPINPRYVGFSSWNSNVTIRGAKVGLPLSKRVVKKKIKLSK